MRLVIRSVPYLMWAIPFMLPATLVSPKGMGAAWGAILVGAWIGACLAQFTAEQWLTEGDYDFDDPDPLKLVRDWRHSIPVAALFALLFVPLGMLFVGTPVMLYETVKSLWA